MFKSITPIIFFILSFLLLTGCGMSKEEARQKLAEKNIEYSKESFANQIEDGNIKNVKLFLTAGMNPNTRNSEGETALIVASTYNHQIVKTLRENEMEVNKKNFEEMLRKQAPTRTEIIQALLGAGADIDGRDKYEQTALMSASRSGLNNIVKKLIEAGASVDAATKQGYTSLYIAAIQKHLKQEHVKIIKTLLRAGANPNVKSNDYLVSSPILAASSIDNYETVKALINGGADPNVKDEEGATALRLAMGYRKSKHVAGKITTDKVILTVKTLLDGGADPTLKSKAEFDPVPESPLEIAREGDYPEVARILREAILKE